LIDMTVVNPAGETLGVLTSILQTGANDVYIVTQPDGTELLLPAIKDVILDIDQPNRRIVAKPLEYL
jgi:16S rRNA processing protein RimM